MPALHAAALADGPWSVGRLGEAGAYILLGLLAVGAVVFLVIKMRAAGSLPDLDAAEADFERQMMLQLGRASSPQRPAHREEVADEHPRTSGESKTGEGREHPPVASNPAPAPGRTGVWYKAAFDRLRAAKPDAVEVQRIPHLAGCEGEGLVVRWNRGHEQALLVEKMPPAGSLQNLLRRFEVIVVTSPAPGGEPVVIDRMSAYFVHAMKIGG